MIRFVSDQTRDLVATLFNSLEERKVLYVVLRNYEGLPYEIGHDIDILVAEASVPRFRSILSEVASGLGWFFVQVQEQFAFQSFILATRDPSKDPERAVKIDVWSPITWRGIPYCNADTILAGKKRWNSRFPIPGPGSEAATLLLKELLQAGKIKTCYFERIQSLASADPDGFYEALDGIFDDRIVRFLLSSSQTGDWSALEGNYQKVRHNLIVRSSVRRPLRTILSKASFFLGHAADAARGRRQCLICLIGPDGSGKSTLSKGILDQCSDLFGTSLYFHGHFGYIPELTRILPRFLHAPSETLVLGRRKKNRAARVLMYLMMSYYAAGYGIGFALLSVKRKSSRLVVFDRYFYDYAIQDERISPDDRIFRILCQFVPKPDLIIWPSAPATIIHGRKPELPIAEIERQENACRTVIGVFPGGHAIENSGPVDAATVEVRRILLAAMKPWGSG